MVDVNELLGIAIGEGEPGALYLYHDTVTSFKYVGHIGHGVFYFGYLSRFERLRFFETVAVAATHYIATYQHFVTAHRVVLAISFTIYAVFVSEIIGEYIYQLYHEISICGGNGSKQICDKRPGKG